MKPQTLLHLLPFLLATTIPAVAAMPDPTSESLLEKRDYRYRCDDDFSQRCGAMVVLNRNGCRQHCSCPNGQGVASCRDIGRGCSGADVKRICSQKGDCECRRFGVAKCRKAGGMTFPFLSLHLAFFNCLTPIPLSAFFPKVSTSHEAHTLYRSS